MTAIHQTRLVVAIGLLATLLAGVASRLAGRIDPVAPNEGTSVHVVWALSAVLVLLLSQCWIGLFGAGSLRLLARRGHRATWLQWSMLVAAPIGVVALTAVTVWLGIQGFTSGRGAPAHARLAWMTLLLYAAMLLAEWWALEALDRRMSDADDSLPKSEGTPAGHSL